MADHALVTVNWQDLVDPTTDLSNAIQQAFGEQGLGILAIRGVPGFVAAKQACLPLAHVLISLPEDELAELEDPLSLYNAGWSFGKEKLGDQPDYSKGSFYYNPLTDTPGTADDRQRYPMSYPINKWPKKIDGFQESCQQLGVVLKSAVDAVTPHVDRLAAQHWTDYRSNQLQSLLASTDKVKARLLYYYPLVTTNHNKQDSWIGWHNDSGFLTALAGDVYVNHTTGTIVDCPDPAAGLYVETRSGATVRVELPSDCCAVQMGECTQLMTGGVVDATPHSVRGPTCSTNTARISLACFVDAPPTVALTMPAAATLASGNVSHKVPPLAARWQPGMTFGDFLTKTFGMYYEWSKEQDE